MGVSPSPPPPLGEGGGAFTIASWINSYFDNVMTKFMISNRTDAWNTDVNLLSWQLINHQYKVTYNRIAVSSSSINLVVANKIPAFVDALQNLPGHDARIQISINLYIQLMHNQLRALIYNKYMNNLWPQITSLEELRHGLRILKS